MLSIYMIKATPSAAALRLNSWLSQYHTLYNNNCSLYVKDYELTKSNRTPRHTNTNTHFRTDWHKRAAHTQTLQLFFRVCVCVRVCMWSEIARAVSVHTVVKRKTYTQQLLSRVSTSQTSLHFAVQKSIQTSQQKLSKKVVKNEKLWTKTLTTRDSKQRNENLRELKSVNAKNSETNWKQQQQKSVNYRSVSLVARKNLVKNFWFELCKKNAISKDNKNQFNVFKIEIPIGRCTTIQMKAVPAGVHHISAVIRFKNLHKKSL